MSDEKDTSAQETPNAEETKDHEKEEANDETSTASKMYDKPQEDKEESEAKETAADDSDSSKKTSNEKEEKEGEPKEGEDEDSGPPEKYDLKLSEGSPLDESAKERIAAEAREQGLSNKDAQLLLEREERVITSHVDAQIEQFQKSVVAWEAECRSDKEIGGAEFNKNVELAKRAAKTWCSEGFMKTLNDTGLGNHPELVRTFFRIGKAMDEDSFVRSGNKAGSQKTPEELFYGNK